MVEILKSPEFGQFVVNVLLALVALIVPMVGAAARGVLSNISKTKQGEILLSVARTAVLAAEQAGLAGLVSDKKASALAAAQAMLADRGLTIDISALDAAIEAAVAEELNRPLLNEAAWSKAQGA